MSLWAHEKTNSGRNAQLRHEQPKVRNTTHLVSCSSSCPNPQTRSGMRNLSPTGDRGNEIGYAIQSYPKVSKRENQTNGQAQHQTKPAEFQQNIPRRNFGVCSLPHGHACSFRGIGSVVRADAIKWQYVSGVAVLLFAHSQCHYRVISKTVERETAQETDLCQTLDAQQVFTRRSIFDCEVKASPT